MHIIHILAAVCAGVFALIGWLNYSTGMMSLGKFAIFVLFGGVAPYLIAFAWAVLVVPPDVRPLVRRLVARFTSKR